MAERQIIDELRANEFVDFVGTRRVDGMTKRAIVAATWLKEERKLVEFDINHLWTCFKMMGWTMPDDPPSLLRTMKKQQYVRAGAATGTYVLSSVGDKLYAGLK